MSAHCKKYLDELAWISPIKRKIFFIIYTTHFKTFQSLKILIFIRSHGTVGTTVQINKYKSFI
jgi:hypothetical protein